MGYNQANEEQTKAGRRLREGRKAERRLCFSTPGSCLANGQQSIPGLTKKK
jgi:hypothetical protein